MTTLPHSPALANLYWPDLAHYSALANRRDLAAGRNLPRHHPDRVALALRIRARRALWDRWTAGESGRAEVIAGLECLR